CVGPLVAGTLIVALGGDGWAATYVGLLFLLGVLAAPFLPETKGKPLPHALWREDAEPLVQQVGLARPRAPQGSSQHPGAAADRHQRSGHVAAVVRGEQDIGGHELVPGEPLQRRARSTG